MNYLFTTLTHKTGIRAACILFVLSLLLAGCSQEAGSNPRSNVVVREATVLLPTGAPTPEPTPVNTRVLPIEALTPAPTPTITPIPDEVMGLVVDVIDGDTIAVVLDGDQARQAYQVRYIGIEAPENTSGNPWGVVAYEVNRRLTQLKIIRLVRDETDFDAEGYLLRHVYINNQLLSIVLAEQGLARAAIEAPDTRFEDEILTAEAQAREEQLGLWGPEPPTPTVTSGGPSTPEEVGTPETPVSTTPGATTIIPTEALTATNTITATVEVTPEVTPEATDGTPSDEESGG